MQPTLKSLTVAVLWTMVTRSSTALPISQPLSKRLENADAALPRHYMHGLPTLETYEAPEGSTVHDINPHEMSFEVADSDSDIPGLEGDATENPYGDFQTVADASWQPVDDGVTDNRISQSSRSRNSDGRTSTSMSDSISVDDSNGGNEPTVRSTGSTMAEISSSDVRDAQRPNIEEIVRGNDRTLMNLLPEHMFPHGSPQQRKSVVA